eukprot:535836-Lingulodinium_polyedra.AAC.1
MGWRFDRWLRKAENVERKEEYDSSSRSAKAKFRKDWAQAKFKECESARIHEQNESHKTTMTGTYMNFDQI